MAGSWSSALARWDGKHRRPVRAQQGDGSTKPDKPSSELRRKFGRGFVERVGVAELSTRRRRLIEFLAAEIGSQLIQEAFATFELATPDRHSRRGAQV